MILKTQAVRTPNYQLEPTLLQGSLKVELKGTFDMTATPDLSLFLVSVEAEVKRLELHELILNVVDVYYLGSSCIKSFISLVEALKKHSFHPQLRVTVSPRLDWHERTFSVLARLAPTLVSIEKAK